MRFIISGIAIVLFAAAPAHAKEGDPIPGADVSAEQNPGGIMVTGKQCAAKKGVINLRGGKSYCDLPKVKAATSGVTQAGAVIAPSVSKSPSNLTGTGKPEVEKLEGRKGRGIAVGRAGGAF